MTGAGERAFRLVEAAAHPLRDEVLAMLRATERRYGELFGAAPACDVRLVDSDAAADSRIDLVHGRPIFTLNLRVLAGYGATGLRVVVAHEVFHMLQMERLGMGGDGPPGARPFPLTLYGEGQATYATTLVLPEIPVWAAFSFAEAHAAACEAAGPRIARRALELWETEDESRVGELFTPGAQRALPPRAGYWLGLQIGEALARDRGPLAVAILRFDDWEPLARVVVALLA